MIRWVKGFMNQPILKAATNVGLLCTHTKGEVVLTWNEIHANGNMPQLLGNAVRKGKASKWESWHRGERPKSRHQPSKPKGYLHWQMVWYVKCLMNHGILKATTNA
jgi:hypothetical protein